MCAPQAGDAFQTRGGIAVAGVLRPPLPLPGDGHLAQAIALATGEALRDLRPSRLATGHGDVLEEPGRAMAGAVEPARRAFG